MILRDSWGVRIVEASVASVGQPEEGLFEMPLGRHQLFGKAITLGLITSAFFLLDRPRFH
jgi:hypothetical protein